MQDIFSTLTHWHTDGKVFALATVLNTWRSAPQPVGASMALTANHEMLGAVSGGCVEGNLLQQVAEVMEQREGRLLHYGVADHDAWEVGLSCGGEMRVWLAPFWGEAYPHVWEELTTRLARGEGAVVVFELPPAAPNPILFAPEKHFVTMPPNFVGQQAKEGYAARQSRCFTYEDTEYFAQVFPAQSKLLVVGANQTTAHLLSLAHRFGFRSTLIDPRRTFAKGTQWQEIPGQLLTHWPEEVLPTLTLDEDTYVVLLTHDAKIDEPALQHILRSPVCYIGALGSRKTQEARSERLRLLGFSEQEIRRIHGPIGVPMTCKTPQEIALSIVAQLVDVRNRVL